MLFSRIIFCFVVLHGRRVIIVVLWFDALAAIVFLNKNYP